MNKIRVISILAVAIGVVVVFRLFSGSRPSESIEKDVSVSPTASRKTTNDKAQPVSPNSGSLVSGVEQDEAVREEAQNPELFSKYIAEEAKTLDMARVDTNAKQKQLQLRANQLNDLEKKHLKNVSINAAQPINERILSVYMLSLTSDVASQNLISEIAETQLPDFGPSRPHSEAEIRNTQELALRYMAIDKIVENYKSNPPQSSIAISALDSLQNHSANNPVPQVRQYAFDKLNKLTK